MYRRPGLATKCASLALALTAAVAASVPVHAASPAHNPPQRPPTTTHVVTAGTTFPVSAPPAGANQKFAHTFGFYQPPTLTIDQVQPAVPVEGQPLQVSFHLTNNSVGFPLTGTVVQSGNGQDLFGGTTAVNNLAPGAIINGLVGDAAPIAGKGVAISLTFTGHIEDGSPAPKTVGGVTSNDSGGFPVSADAHTRVDVARAYFVHLDSFHVNNTRSAHVDTDYVNLSSAVRGPQGDTSGTANWGPNDVNNGDHAVGLVLGPYNIVPDDASQLGFSYTILNNGNSMSPQQAFTDMVNADLTGAGIAIGALLTGGDSARSSNVGEIVVNAVPFALTAQLSVLLGVALAPLQAVNFGNCDGLVAQDEVAFTGTALLDATAFGAHTETHNYPGSDSPGGCGSNSNYDVTWSITRG